MIYTVAGLIQKKGFNRPVLGIVARNAAGREPGGQGMQLHSAIVAVSIGPVEMAGKDGLGAIAEAGFGKGFDLLDRQPAAEGRVGVIDTALEVFRQRGPQGEPLQQQASHTILAEFAEREIAEILAVDLIAMAEKVPRGIPVPGAGGAPSEGIGVMGAKEEFTVAFQKADGSAALLDAAPGQKMPVEVVFVAGQGHPEIEDIP